MGDLAIMMRVLKIFGAIGVGAWAWVSLGPAIDHREAAAERRLMSRAAGPDFGVLVDAGTGCQYLVPRRMDGGLTPRRAPDGSHMGCFQEIARP